MTEAYLDLASPGLDAGSAAQRSLVGSFGNSAWCCSVVG